MSSDTFLRRDASPEDMSWALIDFATWCFESKGNLASTISGKIAAVQYYHRVEAQIEIIATSTLTRCALKGIVRSQLEARTRNRVRLPVTWRMLLDSESLIPAWGIGGRVMWLCLSLSRYFLIARSDEIIIARSSGVAHPVYCLTGKDVAFFSGNNQLEYVHWRQADKMGINFRGHKGDQDQIGEVRARTRDEISGPQSGYRADGGAVALMVELMSCHATLPDDAPLFSNRIGREVKVLKYGQALQAFREMVKKSGRDPKDSALHSLRIGGGSTLAAGGGGFGKSNPEGKPYTVNNMEDSRRVSRRVGYKVKVVARQPGESTVWGSAKKSRGYTPAVATTSRQP